MKCLPWVALSCALSVTLPSWAQTCNEAIEADAPTSRYALKSNGTALDKQTGLVWMRCSWGQIWADGNCQGSPTAYPWQQALQTAEAAVFAGYSDWRLPNQQELQSLVERRCYDPAINSAVFPNTKSFRYWSSTPVAYYSYGAWIVYFGSGDGFWYGKNYNYYVRLVRGRK
jgi:hypothetical protein